MAYDFKKLAEVETLTEVPEGATVLAEVGGQVKRIPGEGLGGGGFTAVFTMDMDTQTVTCDKTFEECVEAFNKREIIGVLASPEEEQGSNSYLTQIVNSSSVQFGYSKEGETTVPLGLVFTFTNVGQILYMADGTIQAQL